MIRKQIRALTGFVAFVITGASVAYANPDGAPWGSADPNAPRSCASCHFDEDPVMDSAAIMLIGLPDRFVPGEKYALYLSFVIIDSMIAGIQLQATRGVLETEDDRLEINKYELRTTTPVRGNTESAWRFTWKAPEEPTESVTFFIAANAGNDDQSFFGDRIHFKTVTVEAESSD